MIRRGPLALAIVWFVTQITLLITSFANPSVFQFLRSLVSFFRTWRWDAEPHALGSALYGTQSDWTGPLIFEYESVLFRFDTSRYSDAIADWDPYVSSLGLVNSAVEITYPLLASVLSKQGALFGIYTFLILSSAFVVYFVGGFLEQLIDRSIGALLTFVLFFNPWWLLDASSLQWTPLLRFAPLLVVLLLLGQRHISISTAHTLVIFSLIASVSQGFEFAVFTWGLFIVILVASRIMTKGILLSILGAASFIFTAFWLRLWLFIGDAGEAAAIVLGTAAKHSLSDSPVFGAPNSLVRTLDIKMESWFEPSLTLLWDTSIFLPLDKTALEAVIGFEIPLFHLFSNAALLVLLLIVSVMDAQRRPQSGSFRLFLFFPTLMAISNAQVFAKWFTGHPHITGTLASTVFVVSLTIAALAKANRTFGNSVEAT